MVEFEDNSGDNGAYGGGNESHTIASILPENEGTTSTTATLTTATTNNTIKTTTTTTTTTVPQKPKSAHLFYVEDSKNRQQMKDEHPNVILTYKFIDFLLSSQWKEIMEDDEQESTQKLYQGMAANDIIRYDHEMDAYNNNTTTTNNNNNKKQQQQKDEDEGNGKEEEEGGIKVGKDSNIAATGVGATPAVAVATAASRPLLLSSDDATTSRTDTTTSNECSNKEIVKACEEPSMKKRNETLRAAVIEKMIELYTHAKSEHRNKRTDIDIMKNVISTTEKYFEDNKIVTSAYINRVGGTRGMNIVYRYATICKRKELEEETSRILSITGKRRRTPTLKVKLKGATGTTTTTSQQQQQRRILQSSPSSPSSSSSSTNMDVMMEEGLSDERTTTIKRNIETAAIVSTSTPPKVATATTPLPTAEQQQQQDHEQQDDNRDTKTDNNESIVIIPTRAAHIQMERQSYGVDADVDVDTSSSTSPSIPLSELLSDGELQQSKDGTIITKPEGTHHNYVPVTVASDVIKTTNWLLIDNGPIIVPSWEEVQPMFEKLGHTFYDNYCNDNNKYFCRPHSDPRTNPNAKEGTDYFLSQTDYQKYLCAHGVDYIGSLEVDEQELIDYWVRFYIFNGSFETSDNGRKYKFVRDFRLEHSKRKGRWMYIKILDQIGYKFISRGIQHGYLLLADAGEKERYVSEQELWIHLGKHGLHPCTFKKFDTKEVHHAIEIEIIRYFHGCFGDKMFL